MLCSFNQNFQIKLVKIAKRVYLRKYFEMERQFKIEPSTSIASPASVIYITSESEDDASDGWNSDWSSEMESMIASVERQISSPMLIAGRIMTTADDEPSTSYTTPRRANKPAILQTPKLDKIYFDEERCYAPSKRDSRIRNRHPIELCSTHQPVAYSHLSPPPHERGPYHHTPKVQAVPNVMQTVGSHIQNSKQFDKIDTTQFTGLFICGKSIQAI